MQSNDGGPWKDCPVLTGPAVWGTFERRARAALTIQGLVHCIPPPDSKQASSGTAVSGSSEASSGGQGTTAAAGGTRSIITIEGEPAVKPSKAKDVTEEDTLKAKAAIELRCSDAIQAVISKCETAWQVWVMLRSLMVKESAQAQGDLLAKLLSPSWQAREDALTYFMRVQGLYDQLLAAGGSLDQAVLVRQVINNLPTGYHTLRTTLNNMSEPVTTLANLQRRVMDEEQVLKRSQPNAAAYLAVGGRGGGRQGGRGGGRGQAQGRGGNGGRGGGRGQSSGSAPGGGSPGNRPNHRPLVDCGYCGMPGNPEKHNKDTCWRRKGDQACGIYRDRIPDDQRFWLHEGKGRKPGPAPTGEPAFMAATFKPAVSMLAVPVSSLPSACGKSHPCSECVSSSSSYVPGRVEQVDVSFAAAPASSLHPDSTSFWVMDSGTTTHMTPYQHLLSNQRTLARPLTVLCSDQGTLKGEVAGEVFFTQGGQTFTLHNVAYVPGLPTNLFSYDCAVSSGAGVVTEAYSDTTTFTKGGTTLVCAKQPEHFNLRGFRATYLKPEGAAAVAGDSVTALLAAAKPSAKQQWAAKTIGRAVLRWWRNREPLSEYETQRRAMLASNRRKMRELTQAMLAHRRAGHLGPDKLAKLPGVAQGISASPAALRAAAAECETCILAKQPRRAFPPATTPQTSAPCQLLHTDLMGPIEPVSRGGSRYVFTALDDYSGMAFVQPMATKAHAFEALRTAVRTFQQVGGHQVQAIRSDNGGEYNSHTMLQYLASMGIQHQRSAPYTPQQNGKAERLNRTLMNFVRAMLLDSGQPNTLWGEAVVAACYLHNRSPSSKGPTPYELFTGHPPDLSHLRVFGCAAYVHVPKQHRSKLDPVAERGILVGYTLSRGTYRVLLANGTVVLASSVTFVEGGTSSNPPPAPQSGAPDLQVAFPAASSAVDGDEGDSAPAAPPPAAAPAVAAPAPALAPAAQYPLAGLLAGDQLGGSDDEGAFHDPGESFSDSEGAVPAAAPTEGAQPAAAPAEGAQPGQAAQPAQPALRRSQRVAERAARPPPEPPAPKPQPQRGPVGVKGGVKMYNAVSIVHPIPESATSHAEAQKYMCTWQGYQRAAPTEAHWLMEDRPNLVAQYWADQRGNEQPPAEGSGSGGSGAPAAPAAEAPADPPVPELGTSFAAISAAGIKIPATYEQAMAGPQGEQWEAAMLDEIMSLVGHGTWVLGRPPRGVRVLPGRWVYDLKRDAQGNVVRFKARWVVKGYRQVQGKDFDETHAPTARLATLRIMLAKAAAEGLEMRQLDIKTAFLYGGIDADVWVEQPPGFVQGSGMACHLRKSLYGLRQAPRIWNQHLTAHLAKLGAVPSAADPCLFSVKSDSDTLYLLVWVDDILLLARHSSTIASFSKALAATFDARDMGEPRMFLGIQIDRDRAAGTIKLSQPRLITDLLSDHGMLDAKPASTPLPASTQLRKEPEQPLDTSTCPYNSVVGSLLYASNTVRPDLTQAVNMAARFMSSPSASHWIAAKHIMRYLRGTTDMGITYSAAASSAPFHGYCDADYGGDTDTRRSTTGYVFMLYGGAISWASRLQPTVAVSTTEAEYMATAFATKEALWLRKVLPDLGISPGAVMIYGDNQSALKLLANPLHSMRSKHIDIQYHFARERAAMGQVQFEYVPTSDQVADIFTKALAPVKFSKFRHDLGMRP